jgi:hypothetical protein
MNSKRVFLGLLLAASQCILAQAGKQKASDNAEMQVKKGTSGDDLLRTSPSEATSSKIPKLDYNVVNATLLEGDAFDATFTRNPARAPYIQVHQDQYQCEGEYSPTFERLNWRLFCKLQDEDWAYVGATRSRLKEIQIASPGVLCAQTVENRLVCRTQAKPRLFDVNPNKGYLQTISWFRLSPDETLETFYETQVDGLTFTEVFARGINRGTGAIRAVLGSSEFARRSKGICVLRYPRTVYCRAYAGHPAWKKVEVNMLSDVRMLAQEWSLRHIALEDAQNPYHVSAILMFDRNANEQTIPLISFNWETQKLRKNEDMVKARTPRVPG